MVNESVVSQHAEEAAFLWMLRNRAVGEPHYSLDDLAVLDERVEAQLAGLQVAGDVGWTFCRDNLNANAGPGEVFTLAVLAFSGGDRARMLEALQAGCAAPALTPGLIAALGWLDDDGVSPWVTKLLDARLAQHRVVGLAACAINRRDPGAVLSAALEDADVSLRARALRAVGELRRYDLTHHLRSHVHDDDAASCFWAAWSLALNGHREGVALLASWVDRGAPWAERALHVALRAMPLDESRDWISGMVRDPKLTRLAILGTAIVGDPVAIPWLIRRMEDEPLAKLAGEAFSMITGADLAYDDLEQDDPRAVNEDEETSVDMVLALDYDSNLPYPAARLVAAWWDKNHQRFSNGTRYLAGDAIGRESLRRVLSRGNQRQRAAAALELALIERDRPLFEVRARAAVQRHQLSAWSW
jgi:uncharacterized protein (TIGR02270 family)